MLLLHCKHKSGEILSSDPLATLLDAAQSPGDKNTSDSKYDAVEFLKLFRAKATTPECKELSIEDGVKVMYLLEQCLANFELDQGELDDMACGMLKLMGDPNWNNNNSAELICQTRTIQGTAAIRNPPPVDLGRCRHCTPAVCIRVLLEILQPIPGRIVCKESVCFHAAIPQINASSQDDC